ncbi:MAG: bifunctional glutamate N-acetyltransferase/amino-acid acetyltransferase ArgJ [Acidimicrobiia bacterium]|nr:bifunctional glutamate N-acetyltransferase/amino-acid acetyltransferase ArgJ [Acidimicrobiia bacterium]
MSVTEIPGFIAAGVTCGIKPSGNPDLALVATADGAPVSAAGVFTSNKMTAAPVLVCQEHLAATGGQAAAVVLNSGNANAATGAQGMADARQMCAETAAALGVAPEDVLVCSTGLIGYALPMDAVSAGITAAAQALTATAGPQAAEAIMTTDTVPKQVLIAGDGFTVGGMAKGAAMLEPNMATMLAVLVTDAAADPDTLQEALREGVDGTFNTLTVDGAESTNDTVLILANGQAGPVDPDALTEAVAAACESLALQMADDAEGSTKTVFLRVTGAASDAEAAKAARDTANCQLVKCSWYGEDPYWGRIASEMGAAGVAFDNTKLTIAYGPHVVYHHGEPAHPPELGDYMTGRHLDLHVDLGMGDGQARIITTDLTHAYIDENMGTS